MVYVYLLLIANLINEVGENHINHKKKDWVPEHRPEHPTRVNKILFENKIIKNLFFKIMF